MPPELKHRWEVATVLTVYGIETALILSNHKRAALYRCNSTYRLRY